MGTSRLTILFDDPFWIGLYEREDDTEYSVCRIVFGAEPRDQEVYAYLLEHWRTLRFQPAPARDRASAPSQKPQAAPAGGPADDPGRRDRHQGPAGPEAPTGAGEAGPSPPAPANSGRRRKRGSSSCGRRVERKSTEVTDLCAFFGTVFIRGLRRRQTLL